MQVLRGYREVDGSAIGCSGCPLAAALPRCPGASNLNGFSSISAFLPPELERVLLDAEPVDATRVESTICPLVSALPRCIGVSNPDGFSSNSAFLP